MSVAPYGGSVAEFPSHSIFDPLVALGEGARVLITDASGEHFGWQFTAGAAAALQIVHPDRVAYGGLRTPSAERLAVSEAETAAIAAREAKDAQARQVILNQMNTLKAKAGAPGTWTAIEKFQAAVAWILYRMD